MTVAGCSQGVTEQKCHAGATVLVRPIDDSGECGIALLTSCAFKHSEKALAWEGVKKRARSLDLDEAEVREAFEKLPDLDEAKKHCLQEIIPIAIEAIKELRQRKILENEISRIKGDKAKISGAVLLRKEFEASVSVDRNQDESVHTGMKHLKGQKTPGLIEVVCSVVCRQPQMPYTVEDLAAAARMTPNYFSSIFRKYTGQCFMDYLTDRRIERAEELLSDPSLNIGEIASMCGYDDPGYFTRRFKKKTGVTPRGWRGKGQECS